MIERGIIIVVASIAALAVAYNEGRNDCYAKRLADEKAAAEAAGGAVSEDIDRQRVAGIEADKALRAEIERLRRELGRRPDDLPLQSSAVCGDAGDADGVLDTYDALFIEPVLAGGGGHDAGAGAR